MRLRTCNRRRRRAERREVEARLWFNRPGLYAIPTDAFEIHRRYTLDEIARTFGVPVRLLHAKSRIVEVHELVRLANKLDDMLLLYGDGVAPPLGILSGKPVASREGGET